MDEGRAHAEGRDGIPQDHGQHPRQRQPGRQLHLRPRLDRPRRRELAAARSPASCSARSTAATSTFRDTSTRPIPRQNAWIFHAGDTWRVNNKLTLDYGLRWDYYSPSSREVRPLLVLRSDGRELRAPVAGPAGWPSRATTTARPATARAYPEEDWYGGFAPRLGAVYSLNDKTVLRAGWGIFYTQAFYPGLGRRHLAGRVLDRRRAFNTTLGGIAAGVLPRAGPAAELRARPRSSVDDYRNGQGILYRPIDANKRPVLAPVEHHGRPRARRATSSLSVAYVGSAGRRLPSSIDPINAIDPSYLSMGDRLYDEFQPGHDEPQRRAAAVRRLGRADDRLRAVGGAGAAAVSAVLRQPAGPEREPRRVALQLAAGQAREALLGRHLRARLLHAVEDDRRARRTTRSATPSPGAAFRASSRRSSRSGTTRLRATDTPHVLSAAFVYELPIGQGKKYMNQGGVANALLGGWQVSTIFRYSSGLPHLLPRQGTRATCPGAFRAGCIPAIINPGARLRAGQGQLRPGQGPAVQQGRLRAA